MRIAIDARALLGQSTGIGTYTRGIASAMAGRPGQEVGLFSPRPLPDGFQGGPWSLQEDGHPFGVLWLQTTLPRRLRRWDADVLLAALTIAPARATVPFVSVVHDLTAWTNPEWHAKRTVIGFLPMWEKTVERAARFVCVSQSTARELTERYPETRSRTRVIPHGLDPLFSPADDPRAAERTRRRYAAGSRYILYLGTLEPRKNVERLVVACERLWTRRRSRPDLVLAGGIGWKTSALARRIARSPFRDKIHQTGYAPREVARDLYRAAEVFVYPSLVEGFGLPVLEAMACGVPVVASTAEALREVGGGAALYAPADDVEALSAAIERALEDAPTRDRLRDAGPERARGFSWESAGTRTLAELAEAAAEGASG
ncbi:MAG: glycosyltransferase family 4 protein [Thermoanaerobaculia bacterium]